MNNDIEKLQNILKEDSSNFQARRELSILLANNGYNEEALSNLKYLEKYFSSDADIHYNIGILYEKNKDFIKAKEAYEKAIKLSPQTDFYYNLGEVLINLEQWDDAINAFKKVLISDIEDGNCFFNLGICYFHKDELNLAIDNFQQAINLNPKDIYAYFYLGCIYQEKALTNFAEECYKKVLEISPDYSWAYYNLASIAYKNENIEEAKNYLLKTIEYNDTDIETFKLLTKIYIKNNEIEDIITILKTRLEKDENGDLFYILSQVYKHIGQKENYLKNLQNSIKNNLTLTYPVDKIKQEYNYNNSESELLIDEIEEYNNIEYKIDEDNKDIDYEENNDEYLKSEEELEEEL